MNLLLHRILLFLLVFFGATTLVKAQIPTVTLTNGDPAGKPADAFDGNVFQSDNQFGDASIYATFSGGAKSFQILSPGENLIRTISSTGYFSIRPTGSMIVDKTKILNFSGTVTGSVTITVKPLTITTISANVITEASPGATLTVSYLTGAGTFPIDLAVSKFKVQLLDANGNLVADLLNSADQTTTTEQFGFSKGGIRSINATIPTSIATGTYRVRVVTQGLTTPVLGSASPSFIIRSATPTIGLYSLNAPSYCAGTVVSFPFTTSGTFPAGNTFKVRLFNSNGTFLQDLTETSASSPIQATLPSTFAGGTYNYQIISTQSSVSSGSNSISIRALPTLVINSSNASITAGALAIVPITLTGTPPWTVSFRDYRPGTAPDYTQTVTFTSNSAILNPTLFGSTTYDKNAIVSFRDGGCGPSSLVSGSAQITVTPITLITGTMSGTLCPGSTISVPFTANAAVPSDALFQVQLSDLNGNFQNGSVIGTGTRFSPITVTLPQNLASSPGYQLRVAVQKPTQSGAIDYTNAFTSTTSSLNISRPDAPKVTDISLCAGSPTGSLSAIGTNLKWYTSSGAQPTLVAPTPPNDRSSQYLVSQTINGCESAQAALNVIANTTPPPPTVTPNQTVCQNAKVSALTASPNVGLMWQGPGINGSMATAPTPTTTQPATYIYQVTRQVGSCTSPPATITFTVRSLPPAPVVPSTVAFCIGQTPSTLTATTSGVPTWYLTADNSGPRLSQIIVNTSQVSTQTYFVTQTDAFLCESPNSMVTVTVSARALARLTGDDYIYPGDSSAIRVRLSGNGPWSFTNWNGQLVNSTDSLYVKWEKPTTTRTYSITNLRSTCGPGDILNSYTLTVRVPLSTKPVTESILLNAYPNPTTGDLSVDWRVASEQPVTIQLINAEGKLLRQLTRQATSQLQTESIKINSQPAGVYFIQLITPDGTIIRRVIKQ